MQVEEADLNSVGGQLEQAEMDVERWRQMALKLVGTRLVRLAAHEPGNVRDVERLTQLLLDSARNDLQRRRLNFEQQRHEQSIELRKEEEKATAERRKKYEALFARMRHNPAEDQKAEI